MLAQCVQKNWNRNVWLKYKNPNRIYTKNKSDLIRKTFRPTLSIRPFVQIQIMLISIFASFVTYLFIECNVNVKK